MKRNSLISAAVASATIMALSACAGGAGGTAGASPGDGFEFGADQSVVDAAVEDLEPVTLRLSSDAPSEEAANSASTLQFKEEIEEKSNGKISIDIAWGHSVTGNAVDVPTALADGRLDLSTGTLVYHPQEFPAYNGLNALSRHVPSSPMEGVVAAAGVLPEIAWQNETVMQEIEDAGLVAINPVFNTGEFFYFCGDKAKGNELSDWTGRQVRAGTTLHSDLTTAMGAGTVSMEWMEVFEALQRNTFDCTITLATTAYPFGILEVAPNISYPNESTFGGQGAAGLFAGSRFNDLPLAYQQIIFDAEPAFSDGNLKSIVNQHALIIEDARANGGEIKALPTDVEATHEQVWDDMLAEAVDAGYFTEDAVDLTQDSAAKWEAAVTELGIEDGGDFGTMDEWYDPDSVDFRPLTDQVYEEIMLPHRPS